MVKMILIGVGSAAAVLLPPQLPFFGGDRPLEEGDRGRSVRAAVERNEAAGHLSDFGDSLRFVGMCSVACSLIGGTAVIVVARNRRRK